MTSLRTILVSETISITPSDRRELSAAYMYVERFSSQSFPKFHDNPTSSFQVTVVLVTLLLRCSKQWIRSNFVFICDHGWNMAPSFYSTVQTTVIVEWTGAGKHRPKPSTAITTMDFESIYKGNCGKGLQWKKEIEWVNYALNCPPYSPDLAPHWLLPVRRPQKMAHRLQWRGQT